MRNRSEEVVSAVAREHTIQSVPEAMAVKRVEVGHFVARVQTRLEGVRTLLVQTDGHDARVLDEVPEKRYWDAVKSPKPSLA